MSHINSDLSPSEQQQDDHLSKLSNETAKLAIDSAPSLATGDDNSEIRSSSEDPIGSPSISLQIDPNGTRFHSCIYIQTTCILSFDIIVILSTAKREIFYQLF